jgi:hypothetical protein
MIPRAGMWKCHSENCHSERSEESLPAPRLVVLEMLRFAQHDNGFAQHDNGFAQHDNRCQG